MIMVSVRPIGPFVLHPHQFDLRSLLRGTRDARWAVQRCTNEIWV